MHCGTAMGITLTAVAVGSFELFDPRLPTLPVLEAGKLVMEVKFTEFLPQIVREIIPPSASEFTAVSKYVLCYEKTRYLHGFTYWEESGAGMGGNE